MSTFLIENGHDPVVVQRMLRQSHVNMTMHYVHNRQKARDAQAQFIEHFLPNVDAGAAGAGAGSRATAENDSRVVRERVRVQ